MITNLMGSSICTDLKIKSAEYKEHLVNIKKSLSYMVPAEFHIAESSKD